MKKSLQKRQVVYSIIIAVLLVLVIARLYMPTWLKNHANQVLDNLPDYHGQVSDVDVHLYRGAYRVTGLKNVAPNQ